MRKHYVILTLFIWGAGAVGAVKAQVQPSSGPFPSYSFGAAHRSYSNVHAVNVQLQVQMRLLRKDTKLGKVTPDQAKIIFEKLKAVRKQELDYFHLNGQQEVTADQKAQLNQLLAQTASSI